MSDIKKIGRFEVTRELGHGGMGVVYLAEDPLLGRQVAIKTISAANFAPDEQEYLLHRLLQEARAASNMRHEGIVTVFDVQQDGEKTYIVMEYVDGSKLSDFLAKGRPDAQTAVRLLRETAEALDYAHGQGIVHRDVKPDNLLLDSSQRIKIADFGIAKSISRHSVTPGAMGTPHYMSPEQVQNDENISGKADEFSLGVIAYFMLTGQKPFDGKSQLAIGQAIISKDPAPAHEVNHDLPREVDAALLRALAKKPESRFPTCAGFVDALEKALEGGTATVSGQEERKRSWKWLLAVAVLAIAVVGLYFAYNQWLSSGVGWGLDVYAGGAPITPGTSLPANDPRTTGIGARVGVSGVAVVPPNTKEEVVWQRDGKPLGEPAELKPGAGEAKLPGEPSPGQYTAMLMIDGVEKKTVGFTIESPTTAEPAVVKAAPVYSLEVSAKDQPLTDGQPLTAGAPPFGWIKKGQLSAKLTADPLPETGTSTEIVWLLNGKEIQRSGVAPGGALAYDKRDPAAGQYTVQAVANGHVEKLFRFVIEPKPPTTTTAVGGTGGGVVAPPKTGAGAAVITPPATAGKGAGPAVITPPATAGKGAGPAVITPPATAGKGAGPAVVTPQPKFTLEVLTRNEPLTSGQRIKLDDEKYGQLNYRDLHAKITPQGSPPPGTELKLIWEKDEKASGRFDTWDSYLVGLDQLGKVLSYRNVPDAGRYHVRLLVNGRPGPTFEFVLEK